VALPQKAPAEGGDGRKIGSAQIQIVIQHKNLILRPGIQGATFCKGKKILHIGDMYGLRFG
jgi:hypothetical protein